MMFNFIIVLALSSCLYYFLMKKSPLLFFLFFLFLYVQVKNIVSASYIDLGNVYMMELSVLSKSSYVSYLLLSLHAVSIFLLYFLFKLTKHKFASEFALYSSRSIKNSRLFLIVSTSLLMLLIVNVLIAGSPLFGGDANKTNIWSSSPLPFLKYVSSQLSFLILVAGIYYDYFERCSCKAKYYFLFFYLLSILYLVLMGHKFGQLVTFSYLFFLPYLISKSFHFKISISKLFIQVSVLLVIFSFFVLRYFESKYGVDAQQLIFDRVFAMEGQLSYVAINSYIEGGTSDFEHFFVELKNAFWGGNERVGMDYLMYLYMPSEKYNYYSDLQVNLSQGYFALLFTMFGSYFSVTLFQTVFIFLVYFVGYLFAISLIRRDFVLIFLYFKIYYSLYTYYVQAYNDAFFNFKNLIVIFLILFVYIARRGFHVKRTCN